MWWRPSQIRPPEQSDGNPRPLREALRRARIESAERTAVIVDLRDAEIARLELGEEALAPVFAEIPSDIELFDHGISRGETPRLWIDPVAHVHMGRDKRVYRFVQDSRNGRRVLAESTDAADVTEAVTTYVARRMLEREHALAAGPAIEARSGLRRRGRSLLIFVFGVAVGVAILFIVAALSVRPTP